MVEIRYYEKYKGFRYKIDISSCLKCGKIPDRIHPDPKRPGFCISCSKERCLKCGIVIGSYPCQSWACNEHHGERSLGNDKICKSCEKRKSGLGKVNTRKMIKVLRVIFNDTTVRDNDTISKKN